MRLNPSQQRETPGICGTRCKWQESQQHQGRPLQGSRHRLPVRALSSRSLTCSCTDRHRWQNSCPTMFRSRASENQKDSHWIKKTRFHLVADGFLSKEVSTQGLAGSFVSRILFDAIPEKKSQTCFTLTLTHLLGLKREAMSLIVEDFPPDPEPFLEPKAAPARLVRVPFKPELSQFTIKC